MKTAVKEFKSTVKEAVIPAGITLFVFFAVLFIKGIYPFGELRIDYYDMGQTNAPLYYHIWDFLHGKGSLFYSWYIDGGQNLSMGSSIQWNISVFNLFFLFIRRTSVMRSLSIFMGIHLFFMAFNMDVFLRRAVGTARFYRILFSIAYGLTGYTLTHYTIPAYLDTAALMPLYLLTLHEALKPEEPEESRINPVLIYSLMTGYMTALGYYMAFMNLIFILLVSGTYVFVLCGKDMNEKALKRSMQGRAATRLGIGTFAGIGLSCFMLVPAAMQMMHSSRFNSNLSGGFFETLHDILWAIGADMYYIKWWLLSGSILAIVIVLSGLVRFHSEKRISLFIFLFCMYPCALIVFESINLLWHMGTYYHYPIRCGYLIPIVLLTSAAFYTGRTGEWDYVNRKNNSGADKGAESYVNRNTLLLTISSVAASVTGVLIIRYYLRHEVWQTEELFKAWVIFAAILGAVYILIWCIIRKPAFLAPVLMMELIITAYIGYGQPHFTDRFSKDPEQSGEYVVISQQLSEDLGLQESRTDRIKNPDTTLNTNYGFILRRATVGGWANTVPRGQLDAAVSLGYGAHFMRILDCGGTLLSDAALHVTETLTTTPKLYTAEAWEVEGEADGYTLLKNKYTLPFAVPVENVSVFNKEAEEAVSEFDICRMTNALYELISPGNTGSGIMKEITGETADGEYYVNHKKALYLAGGEFSELKINGSVVPVPDISDAGGTSYPGWFNSSLLYLGIYEDQELSISGDITEAPRFFELDLEKLEELCAYYGEYDQEIRTGRSELEIVCDGSAGKSVLIPLAYDEGFRAKVNDKEVPIGNASDLFMEIPLEDGRNEIKLSFVPKGLIPGMLISLFCLALMALFSTGALDTAPADSISRPLLAAVFGAFVIVLYLIPYIAFLIHQIEKRI